MLRAYAVWDDTQGNPIHAHGGYILKHGDDYYWYGEYKMGKTDMLPVVAPDGNTYNMHRLDFKGISCYHSRDLVNWRFCGLSLLPDSDSDSDLHPANVVERPRVLYNAKTNKFVMFLHIDNAGYSLARVGVAVSDTPDGCFIYRGATNPCGQESRDFTVFADDDGKGYLYHSSEANKTLHIVSLSEDYTDFSSEYKRCFADMSREAPVVFKENGQYYMITSGCSGWAPNMALWAEADRPDGDFELKGNPCQGENSDITFHCQASCAVPVKGGHVLLLDRWNSSDLENSRYVLLAIDRVNGEPKIEWSDCFESISKP